MKFFIVLFAIVGLGLAAPTKTLDDDLKDILSLIPVLDIKAIADKHMANDPEFQQVVHYLQGEEWQKIVEAVRANAKYQEFKNFLEASGIDVDKIIQIIHDIIANAKPNRIAPRSLRQFLDEVEAIIPGDAILVMINNKLETSEAFVKLYEQLSSEDFHQLCLDVKAIPEVQRLREVLIGMGVDVEGVEEFIKQFLGWA